MKSSTEGPNRLSRISAKEVPHRADERFFAAKADVRSACEDLLHDLRHSAAHQPMVADLETAVKRVEQQLKDIAPDEPKASTQVREMAKEVKHLQLAETWVSATERVLTRLGSGCPRDVRDELLEAQEGVMWCVRAQHWDGELTGAITRLEKLVKDAEVLAARAQ